MDTFWKILRIIAKVILFFLVLCVSFILLLIITPTSETGEMSTSSVLSLLLSPIILACLSVSPLVWKKTHHSGDKHDAALVNTTQLVAPKCQAAEQTPEKAPGVKIFRTLSTHYHIPSGTNAKKYAQSLLDSVEFHCNEINNSSTVFDFYYSYCKLAELIDELIWLNEKKHVFMSPSPRYSWSEIQRDLGKTIDCFIDRAIKYFPSNSEARADAIDNLCDEIKANDGFKSLFRPENNIKVAQLREEAKNIRLKTAEKFEIQQKNDILNSIGIKKNVDASGLHPFAVNDKLEERIKTLYQHYLVNGLSPADGRIVFLNFKERCESSTLPLASEVMLESLLAEYQPRFCEENALHAIDQMEGHNFEHWCAKLLEDIGYTNVSVTQGSGDYGVDVLASKEGIRYAIQCKCYSRDLDSKPVREVNSGKSMPIYDCHIGAVMTNRYFTKSAIEEAKANHILLWDRDWIKKAIEQRDQLRSSNE